MALWVRCGLLESPSPFGGLSPHPSPSAGVLSWRASLPRHGPTLFTLAFLGAHAEHEPGALRGAPTVLGDPRTDAARLCLAAPSPHPPPFVRLPGH